MRKALPFVALLAAFTFTAVAQANMGSFRPPVPRPPDSQPTTRPTATQPAKAAAALANPHAALAIGLGLSAALAGGGLWLARTSRRDGR